MLRKIISGLIGAAGGLLVLAIINATFFSTSSPTTETETETETVLDIEEPAKTIDLPPKKKIVTEKKVAVETTPEKKTPLTKEPESVKIKEPIAGKKAVKIEIPKQPPVKLPPEKRLARNARASAAKGNTEKAIALYKEAIEIAPTDMEILDSLASLYRSQKRYVDTIPIYHEMLKAGGGRSVKHNLALATYACGESYKAKKIYRELIEEHPDYIVARQNLAVLCKKTGDFKQAATLLEGIISQEPENYRAILDLGEIYSLMSKNDKALSLLTKAAKLKPDQGLPWLYCGRTAFAAGSHGRAVAYLNRASKGKGLNAHNQAMIGDLFMDIYHKIRKKEILQSAIDAWEKAASITPADKVLREKIKKTREQING